MTGLAETLCLVAAVLLSASAPQAAAEAPAEPGASAEAGKDRARELLTEGNARLDRGLYLEALELFERAFAAYPSPRLHFNIAQTHHELGRTLEALRRYELFVRDVPREERPEQFDLANERIFELLGAIATVQLQVNIAGAVVVIDGRPSGSSPLNEPQRLMPGPHLIMVDKPGYQKEIVEVELKAGENLTRRVKMLTEEEAAAQLKVVQRAEQHRREAQALLEQAQRRQERARARLRSSGWAVLGVGALASLGAGGLGVAALDEARKVEKAPDGTSWTEVKGSYDRSVLLGRTSLYVAVAGGVLGVASGVLLYYGHRLPEAETAAADEKRSVRMLPVISSGQAGVVLAGSF